MKQKTLAERIAEERLDKSLAQPFTVKSLAKRPERLNFEIAIQRNAVWTDDQKSLLIHSILLGYPVPPVYTVKSADNRLWLLDGKQRLTTLIDYVNNKFELSNDTPDAFDEEIAGLKFEQLPEEFKEIIADHNITFYQFEHINNDQISTMFLRLNNGTALSPTELNRAILGTENMVFIEKIAENDFFKMASFSDKQLNHFINQELVIQVLMVAEGKYNLSTKELRSYALQLRENGISDNNKTFITNACQYLYEAFNGIDEKQRKKILKKNDIVALFGVVNDCMGRIQPEQFGKVVSEFLLKPSQRYKDTKAAGSAKPEKVEARIRVLKQETDKIVTVEPEPITTNPEVSDNVNDNADNEVNSDEKQDEFAEMF